MMKTLLKTFLLILITASAMGQTGTGWARIYGDSVTVMGTKFQIRNLPTGALTDSLLGHRANSNVTRIAISSLPFVPLSSLVNYSTTSVANTLYYPLSANPASYLTSVPAQSFSSLTGKPTTLSGYGITDAYPLSSNPAGYLTSVTYPVSSVFGRTGAIVATNGDYNTSQVTEMTNLYYTTARFNTAFASKSTTDLIEGTNQYFTTARARSSISATGNISYNSTTGIITATKRQETYTGTTAGSGTYTVTYGTAYSVEPNVIISQRGGTPTNTLVLSSSSTTGFTVTANNRVEVLGLLPTYPTLNGAVVNIIVTEK